MHQAECNRVGRMIGPPWVSLWSGAALIVVTAPAALAIALEIAATILVLAAVVVPFAAAPAVGAGPLEISFLARILEFLADQAHAAVVFAVTTGVLLAAAAL